MERKLNSDPSFISCFKDRRKALQALNILISAKENNYTYKQILDMAFFRSLFKNDYIDTLSIDQFEWKLKNIARDLKKIPFASLNTEWHIFKEFFEGTRRKNKINAS